LAKKIAAAIFLLAAGSSPKGLVLLACGLENVFLWHVVT
jgi:hypothetical protein